MLNNKALAASASAPKIYVEDVFSTWLYTGNGSTQTITNGIDLAGEGGMVWIKNRSQATGGLVFDTNRGVFNYLTTHLTSAAGVLIQTLTSFNADGFTHSSYSNTNGSGDAIVSWTFRKAAKFFDVVTYVGDGNASQTVNHSLGSAPGCIIVKRIDSASNWFVGHRQSFNSIYYLNSTSAAVGAGWDGWISTSTTFRTASISGSPDMNVNGATYVAYLFAHDAGGFGAGSAESVIKCGSYTGNGSTNGPTVDLGWEPQWLLFKNTSGASNWFMYDNMRGLSISGNNPYYLPNGAGTENSNSPVTITSTGFTIKTDDGSFNNNGQTYIYIAIRRGPMKTPTDATKVFSVASRGPGTNKYPYYAGFSIDFALNRIVTSATEMRAGSRLTGANYLQTPLTNAEAAGSFQWDDMTTYTPGESNSTEAARLAWMFRRAPGFMDVVAYTGTDGLSRTLNHNLGVSPELLIFKSRNSTEQWWVSAPVALGLPNPSPALKLNTADAKANNNIVSAVSASTFTTPQQNDSGYTYIAYLFATCPGVSKVGSYTGTGTTLDVDCGFTNGARFVLIKRTDSTGSWYVWDTARGIVSGNDPYLLLNSTAAEVTNTDYIDPLSSGFQISSTAPAEINANGGSYIFLAVA